MLGDMREQGTPDAKLQELITPENYERYKKISRPMTENKIKSDFAIKTVSQQQGLMVSRDEVDEEIMTLQAQALQRGEKFKESEVRPKVEQTLERTMVLNWLQSHSKLSLVDPTEESVEEILGQTPEELAEAMRDDISPAKV
jgi:FKBP-type peptidyl-prolyl cis-trans isomerase (trigger factor)